MNPDLANIPAEREVLSALAFGGADALVQLHRLGLDRSDFTLAGHRAAFGALVEVLQAGEPVTPATLQSRAEAAGESALALASGEMLMDLGLSHSGTSGLPSHARIVAELSRRRHLVSASMALRAAAEDLQSKIDDAVTSTVTSLAAKATRTTRDPRGALWDALDDLEQQSKLGGALPGVSCGIPSLDSLTDGWERGRLIVIAARPGCGKTAFGVWCGTEAMREDAAVFFWTGEQPERKLQQRRLGVVTGYNLRKMLREDTYQHHRTHVAEVAAGFAGQPWAFNETARTPVQLHHAVQAEIAMGRKPRLVVVDYLTKLRADGTHERHDLAVGTITWSLARMAVDLDLSVVLLAQLNRDSVRGGTPRRPGLSDLRDSGEIEQDADQVIMLWEPPAPEGVAEGFVTDATVEFLVEKNRHGPVGSVRAAWNKGTGRYSESEFMNRHLRIAS